MDILTSFDVMGLLLKKEGLRCVLIGGFAVNFYRTTRQTADIDFLIAQEDFPRFKSSLENMDFKVVWLDRVFARFHSEAQKHMDIDFMFTSEETLRGILQDAKKVSIAGNEFLVPSLYHLIALKLHSIKHNEKREYKDLMDILNLVKNNQIQASSDSFKELCLKYGTPLLYEKITGWIK